MNKIKFFTIIDSGDSPEIEPRAQLSRLLPEDGDRVQSPKRCF
jgi:hypothetical protein